MDIGPAITRRRFIHLVGLATAAGALDTAGAAAVPLAGADERPSEGAGAFGTRPRAAAFGIEEYNDIIGPAAAHQASLSADGRFLAYGAVRLGDATFLPAVGEAFYPTGAPGRWAPGVRLWVTDTVEGSSRPLTARSGRAWSPRWNPAGDTLAFLADHDGAVHLWVWQPGERPRRLSRAVVGAGIFNLDVPQWSADGSRIYVPLLPEREPDAPPAVRPGAPAVDVLRSPARSDGEPYLSPFPPLVEARDLGEVDARSGRYRRLLAGFPATYFVLSPDGSRVAVAAVRTEPGPTAGWRFDLYVTDTDGSAPVLARGNTTVNLVSKPAWSPDSTRLAHLRDDGALTVADTSEPRGHTALAGPDGSGPFRAGSGPIVWTPDGARILARDTDAALWCLPVTGGPGVRLDVPSRAQVVQRDGVGPATPGPGAGGTCLVFAPRPGAVPRTALAAVPLDGGPTQVLFEESGRLGFASSGGVSADGTIVVCTTEDDDRPPELMSATVTGADRRRLSRFNPHLDGVALGRSRPVPFTSGWGEQLVSRLLVPPAGEPPFPTLTIVYPSWARPGEAVGGWTSLEDGTIHGQVLAARGWAVLYPAWPERAGVPTSRRDVADLVDPAVDAAVATGLVDPDRLAVCGQSNGGWGTNLVITASSRFRAAASAAGMADLVSFFGQLRITPDGRPAALGVDVAQLRAGFPWADDASEDNSPVRHLDRVTTPLLLIHGREDTVGFEQAGEMFVGLSVLGRDVTLLAYRDETHVPIRFTEANRTHMTGTLLAFLDEHTTPHPPP